MLPSSTLPLDRLYGSIPLGTVRFFWSELGDFAVLLRRLVKLKIHKQWQLEGHSVERMYLRQSCSDGSR